IEHRYADRLENARVLDLFAGTGALGLEALSRGADFALFIEEAAAARALIRTNVENLGLQGRSRIFRRDATRIGAAGTIQPFDIVLADPPYGNGYGEKALAAALAGGWLVSGALVMVEEAVGSPFQPPEGFHLIERREYGTSCASFVEYA
ncbi:RsmD family RNA methyltransferase, partial [uncultured Nitratireductor sp.]|uniref:RsmD family RNA methyltransferase n=1 Tax=uncultured Nitratireductor sp. TaxID=520953 RepID=UPI0025E9C596